MTNQTKIIVTCLSQCINRPRRSQEQLLGPTTPLIRVFRILLSRASLTLVLTRTHVTPHRLFFLTLEKPFCCSLTRVCQDRPRLNWCEPAIPTKNSLGNSTFPLTCHRPRLAFTLIIFMPREHKKCMFVNQN